MVASLWTQRASSILFRRFALADHLTPARSRVRTQPARARHLAAVLRSGPEVTLWEAAAPVMLAIDSGWIAGNSEVIQLDANAHASNGCTRTEILLVAP